MVRYYPMLMSLADRLCVVVGGGDVAARKVEPLLECAARVRVISPRVVPTLASLAAAGALDLVSRPYQTGDLAGAALAIAATDEPATNVAVWQEATASGLPVNVVDDPAHCSFTVPASLRRGPLLLTVSTGGASPALSGALRRRLARDYGPQWGDFACWLAELRGRIKDRFPALAARERVWAELLDDETLAQLSAGHETEARARVEANLARLTDSPLTNLEGED